MISILLFATLQADSYFHSIFVNWIHRFRLFRPGQKDPHKSWRCSENRNELGLWMFLPDCFVKTTLSSAPHSVCLFIHGRQVNCRSARRRRDRTWEDFKRSWQSFIPGAASISGIRQKIRSRPRCVTLIDVKQLSNKFLSDFEHPQKLHVSSIVAFNYAHDSLSPVLY